MQNESDQVAERIRFIKGERFPSQFGRKAERFRAFPRLSDQCLCGKECGGSLILTHSNIAGNSFNDGGELWTQTGNLTIASCAIANHSAPLGCAGIRGGAKTE